jgi:hypothetical protein
LRDLARQQGVPLKTPDLRWPKAATYDGGRLLLSRPDHHVAWRGDGMAAASLALIDRRGAASQSSEKPE